MEIDFRNAREALIYDIGIKTGIIQREIELQRQSSHNSEKTCRKTRTVQTARLVNKLQNSVDFTINVIKGL